MPRSIEPASPNQDELQDFIHLITDNGAVRIPPDSYCSVIHAGVLNRQKSNARSSSSQGKNVSV
ncbi:hypothetical protein D3029_24495 [Escherichia coli]|nr:hypothetical protein [Escherichia coli]EFN9261583.1 hypothetical protein [Escherichia coli]